MLWNYHTANLYKNYLKKSFFYSNFRNTFATMELIEGENVVITLEVRCVKAGINLTQLCEKAEVDRDLIGRWQKDEPKSLQILRKLSAAMSKIEEGAVHA